MLMLTMKMTRATMIYAIIVLVALSALATAEKEEEKSDGHRGKSTRRNLYALDGFKFKMDEQLGHFKRLPFTNLYRNYIIAMKSDDLNSENIPQDSNKWYRPDYATCYGFLSKTVKDDTIFLRNLLDMIVADACAGYVVDRVYEQEDVSDTDVADIKKYTPACEKFYKTKIDNFHPGKRSCMANLLAAKVYSKSNHQTEECHHSLIQAFIQFAECANYHMLTNRYDDNYVMLMYDLLRSETKVCFAKQLELINSMIRKDFGSDSWLAYFTEDKSLNIFRGALTKRQKQQVDRLWDNGLLKVLKAVENTEEPINLREVSRILSHKQNGDELLEDRFLTNIAEFAMKDIKPKVIGEVQKQNGRKKGIFKVGKKKYNAALEDPTGDKRYKNMVDEMCAKFRVNLDGVGPEYVKPLIRLVKLLDFPFTFQITEPNFVKMVVTDSKESAPIYLAVIACHFLGLTEGSLRDRNSKPYYHVKWVNNADSQMVVWPLSRYV